MHNCTEFLSRLSSNAYEFDKTAAFSFKGKCCYLRKKIIEVNHSSLNIHRVRTLILANVCFKKKNSVIGEQAFKGKINCG